MLRKKLLVLGVIGVLAILQGCASPASSNSMKIADHERPSIVNDSLAKNMTVRSVSGGKETNPMLSSQVDSNSFRDALNSSLRSSGYDAASNPKYFIDADIQALTQPIFGLTFNVVSTIRYTVEGEGKRKLFPITATGTATTSDAFVGTERLKIANERSIKENIKLFLKELAGGL
jgi:hypothetical protein